MFVTMYIVFVAVFVLASLVIAVRQWRRLRRLSKQNEAFMQRWEQETLQLFIEAMKRQIKRNKQE